MKDVMRPPATTTRSEISKAVGKLERMKLRRRALAKKLEQQKRLAADLITDAVPTLTTTGEPTTATLYEGDLP